MAINLGIINGMIATAIDNNDAKGAIAISDLLRRNGMNYNEIYRQVRAVRPNVTEADWEALLYEGDTEE